MKKTFVDKVIEEKGFAVKINERNYDMVKSKFQAIYQVANMDYVVGDIESPDEVHDRFFVQVTSSKYFWVEMNYETEKITMLCWPKSYKCVGSNEKFNLTGTFDNVHDAKIGLHAFYEAMRVFAV